MHTYCLFNGEVKDTSQPVFKINDLAILRGYGIFDFMPIKRSIPLFFDDYWKRFSNSARITGLPLQFSQEEFKQQIQTLIQKNQINDGYCRVILTGGYSSNGFSPDGTPNCVITTMGEFGYDASDYEGTKLLTLLFTRENPLVKSLNYSTVLMQQEKLKSEGASDVLYIDENSIVSESSRANFFILNSDGILMTPETNILPGITRKNVLAAAEKTGIPVKIKDFHLDEVRSAQSAFMTSTTKNIMPVTKVDDFVINEGKVVQAITDLQARLDRKIAQYITDHSSK